MIDKEKYSGMSREELLNQLQIINELLDENGLPFSEYSDKDKIKHLNNYFRSIGIPEIYRFTDITDVRRINDFYGIRYDTSRVKDIEYMDSIFNDETLIELFKFAKRFKDMYDLISLESIDVLIFFDGKKTYKNIIFYDKLKVRKYSLRLEIDNGKMSVNSVTITTRSFLDYCSEDDILEFQENNTDGKSLEFKIFFAWYIDIYDELAPKKIMDRIYKDFGMLKDKISKRLKDL